MTDTFDIPSWAVNAIEYGDYSGLSEDDIALVKKFMEGRSARHSWDFENTSGFNSSPAFGLPCGTVPCTFVV